MTTLPPKPTIFRLNLLGDVMLGRLIDQLFPAHVHEPSEARVVSNIRSQAQYARLASYGPRSPWGNALPLLHEADLTLINLETAATTHNTKWPDKVFNYRMHPVNISALNAAKVDYASLANNHSLDFSEPGLLETVRTVKGAKIAFAGAGENREEACRPAVLTLPSTKCRNQANVEHGNRVECAQKEPDAREYNIHVYSASDHPHDWKSSFHTRASTTNTDDSIPSTTSPVQSTWYDRFSPPALKVFSVHWGPNYRWRPSSEIRSLAHWLIDVCGVDIVHGHSSHHVQGVEIYKERLIVYGCGDFVDDYAVNDEFRNDLSAVWRVSVEPVRVEGGEGKGEGGLRVKSLEVFPTRIERFQAEVLEQGDPDHGFVVHKVRALSKEMGTVAREELGGKGQLIFELEG
ncbi:hypothetical protein H2203_007970 [Taxawa tesnikishii (nom. ined.)]|nr:hypothetical protein H2203_007970 [Dothideales sp. JES 119]